MINKVILTGRLVSDPELRYSESGVAFSIFTLAVERNFTNKNGQKDTDFIDIMVWRKQAENCVEYLSQGSLIGVEGRLQIRKTKKGEKTYINPEVVAESVQFLDSGSPKNSSRNKRQEKKDDSKSEEVRA
ncbi:MAG: single-stranded DNA-binding protein [Bacillota bacterium]